MKKIINIKIQGISFQIEEDAYSILKEYNKKIKDYFISRDDEEIIEDIELRIAENLNEEITGRNEGVITVKDVEKIITSMGEVEEFEDLEEDIRCEKGLYRDSDDVIFAGVCSGIAKYFNIKPIFIRLIFIILIFVRGMAIPLYILLWILIPEAKTPLQKLKMNGEKINLKSLKEKIEESEQVKASSSLIRRSIKKVIEIITKCFNFCFKIFLKLVGLGLFLGSIVFLIGSIFGILFFDFNIYKGYFNEQTLELINVFSQFDYFAMVMAFFAMIIIPCIFGIIIGFSILKNKNFLKMNMFLSLFILWFINFGIFGLICFKYIPQIDSKVKEIENMQKANILTRNIELKDFNKISISANAFVDIDFKEEYKIEVSEDLKKENIITVTKKDKTLFIDVDEKVLEEYYNNQDDMICLVGCDTHPTEIKITLPCLKSLSAENGTININDIDQDKLDLKVFGSANVYINGEMKDFSLEEEGGYINFKGGIADFSGTIGGHADFYSKDLKIKKLEIDLEDYSTFDAKGEIEYLEAKVKDNAYLNLKNCLIKKADIETHGDSRTNLNTSSKTNIKAFDFSQINYCTKLKPNIEKTKESNVIEDCE